MNRALVKTAVALLACLGAHCAARSQLGPIVHQNAATVGDSIAPASAVRFKRASADYRSAYVLLRGAPRATIRSCEGAPREFGSVEGEGHVGVEGACVEVAFAEPSATAQVQIVTDIGRRIVLQGSCGPAPAPCAPEDALVPGATVGEEGDRWTLWAIEIERPGAPR